ncbi:MAG: thioredoxin family protein [Myxococcota bacterium]
MAPPRKSGRSSRRSSARGSRGSGSPSAARGRGVKIRRVGAGEFVAAVMNSPVPVLVDFYADWCAPCKTVEPRLQRLAVEVGASARIVKVDADREKALMKRQRVQTLPTWILFQGGREVLRKEGPKDLPRVEERLRALIREERQGDQPSPGSP